MLISTLHKVWVRFRCFCWRADCTSWNKNCACMNKHSEEGKAQKSTFITGPNPKASCGFSNQSRHVSIVSHREEKSRRAAGGSERDKGRGTALSQRASRQNQARRLRMLADWCAWNTLSALEMPKCTVDTLPASVWCSFMLQEHTLGAEQPLFEPKGVYLTTWYRFTKHKTLTYNSDTGWSGATFFVLIAHRCCIHQFMQEHHISLGIWLILTFILSFSKSNKFSRVSWNITGFYGLLQSISGVIDNWQI